MWETLLEMESFYYRASENDPGATALVLNLADAFERVSPSNSVGLGNTLQLSRKILRVLCLYFEHQRRVQFEGRVLEPLQTITAILRGSKWSCLPLLVVLQDALTEASKKNPPLKLSVFVDDSTAL